MHFQYVSREFQQAALSSLEGARSFPSKPTPKLVGSIMCHKLAQLANLKTKQPN